MYFSIIDKLLQRHLSIYYKKVIQLAINRSIIKLKVGVRLLNLFKHGKLTCEICGQPLSRGKRNKKGTIDHIIPQSIGGSNSLDNLQIAHKYCNRQKGSKFPYEKIK